MNLSLLSENLLFFAAATAFLGLTSWAWRSTKPYDLPQPLPAWFKVWFLTVQIGGGVLPLIGLIWSIRQGYSNAVNILAWYFIMLIAQIISESLSLRRFRSVVFVMVPYLYLPYRIWQLFEGSTILQPTNEPIWLQYLMGFEIGLWTANYALDLSQLPRLLHWEMKA